MSGFGTHYREIAAFLAAYAIASVIAATTILLATGAFETIGAGLLAPLFLVPSILLYVLLARHVRGSIWKHVGYVAPAMGIAACLLICLALDLSGYVNEGSGIPLLMLVTFGVPALFTYLFLLRIDSSKRGASPAT